MRRSLLASWSRRGRTLCRRSTERVPRSQLAPLLLLWSLLSTPHHFLLESDTYIQVALRHLSPLHQANERPNLVGVLDSRRLHPSANVHRPRVNLLNARIDILKIESSCEEDWELPLPLGPTLNEPVRDAPIKHLARSSAERSLAAPDLRVEQRDRVVPRSRRLPQRRLAFDLDLGVDVDRLDDGDANEASPFDRLVAVELDDVEVELVDRREEGAEAGVLEDADEEGFAGVRREAGGLEGEPVGRVGDGERSGFRGGDGARANGFDYRLGLRERDGASAALDEDEAEEVGAGFSGDEGGFGGLEAADLDEGRRGRCGRNLRDGRDISHR